MTPAAGQHLVAPDAPSAGEAVIHQAGESAAPLCWQPAKALPGRCGPAARRRAYSILALVGFVGTFVAFALATASGRLPLTGGTRLFHAGPDAVTRVRAILLAIAGLIAAISVAWGVCGHAIV